MESRRINFADPDYEPTDEELESLMKEAFAGIQEAREDSLRQMHARIAAAQADLREQLPELMRRAREGR